MLLMADHAYQYAFVGGLRQDYCITHDNRLFLHQLGGNAVYAAIGAMVWGHPVGIMSRVGSNFPTEWLAELQARGVDTSGVVRLESRQDTRTFYAYLSPTQRVDINPASHFLRIGKPLPKELIDYVSSTEQQGNRETFSPLAVQPADLPPQLNFCRGVHLAPADYLTHLTLPFRLRQQGVRMITIDPSVRYLMPAFRRELRVIIEGLDAFLPSEKEAARFFRSQVDIWQMAEAFSEMGVELVVIKRGPQGQIIWDQRAGKRWQIPAYPVSVRNVTGAGDAFCGAFMAALDATSDPVEACLRGNVAASLVVEGSGVFFALEALPGLALARLEALRPTVKRV